MALHPLEPLGCKVHFNYLNKTCKLPFTKCVLICFQNKQKSTQESKKMSEKIINDGKEKGTEEDIEKAIEKIRTDSLFIINVMMKYISKEISC